MNALYGDKFQAFSAGTKPSRVNLLAIEVMKEIGMGKNMFIWDL